jgi:hypothetical protein
MVGCGYVGEPLPPLIQIPGRISDLTAIQFGKHIKLSWTVPKFNTDGSAVTTLSRIEIYRLLSKSDSTVTIDGKLFVQSAIKWMVLDEANFGAYREGEKLVLADRLQGLDEREIFQGFFSYAIKAINQKKQDAGFSNLVTLKMLPVPTPPEGVHFSFGEQFIELSWQGPTYNIDGSPVEASLKFNVYRNLTPEARVKELLTRTPLEETRFKDTSMVLGQTYYYVVRSVINTPEGPIESFDSQERKVKNVDTYPPRAPAEVVAIGNGDSISLVWLPNTETDLAGYYVYRSGEEHDYQMLTEQMITAASYVDKSVQKGKTYSYQIKAVDRNGNESNYSEEVSEKVE